MRPADSDVGSQPETPQQFLLAALAIVETEFPDPYAFAANPIDPLLPATARVASPYVSALQHFLYSRCFVRPLYSIPSTSTITAADGDLTASLSHANRSCDQWDPNWKVTQVYPQGQIRVTKNGNVRVALPGQFISPDGRDQPTRPGNTVTLFAAREAVVQQPGFYFAFGETLLDVENDTESQIRFYWNVKDTAVHALLSISTASLNRFQIPFRMKCLSRRGLYPRLDAAIVYVHRRFSQITAQLLLEAHQQLANFVGPHTPPLTLRIASGLAVAEDPASEAGYSGAAPDESFGTHRCRVFAEGIYLAHLQGHRDREDRLQEVCRHFQRNGLSLDKPYLNPGSHEDFHVSEGSL